MQQRVRGYLLAWQGEAGTISREDLTKCERLKFINCLKGADGKNTNWEYYSYRSDNALLGEMPQGQQFIYTILCRRSGQRLLLLAQDTDIVDHLVSRELSKVFVPNLRHVSIRVGELVSLVVKKPQEYVLTRVYARVPSFGTSLNAISYYGDDLANAKMFRDSLSILNCTSCGVAELRDTVEIAVVATNGRVSFLMTGYQRAYDVEALLGYISKAGLID